jgi:rhodanese-related sulfurtransferase
MTTPWKEDLMRKAIALAVVLFAAAGTQAQMKKVPPQQKSPLVVNGARNNVPGFPRISQADAMKLYREGKAVFVDVRSETQFTLGHIKGALSIPGSQIIRRFAEVPTQKTVITYCACSAEQSSGRAASDLIAHGVRNVFALKGGWADWQSNGYPSATGAK